MKEEFKNVSTVAFTTIVLLITVDGAEIYKHGGPIGIPALGLTNASSGTEDTQSLQPRIGPTPSHRKEDPPKTQPHPARL